MAEASIKAGDIAELEDQMTQLWKGATDGVQETEFSRTCEANGGKPVGIGPNCDRDEEIGKRSYALCWYDATIDCMRDFTATWEPACRKLEHMMARGTVCNECLVQMFDAWVTFKLCETGETESEPGVANQCECRQCDVHFFQDEPDEEEDPEQDVDPRVPNAQQEPAFDEDLDKVDPLKLRTVKTNSAYTIIPRLWGRYVTNGNIIWIGNKVTENISYTKTLDGGGVTTVNDTITKVDFLVALAIGPLDSVMRIWADDLLIYNATLPYQNGNVALSEFNNGTNSLNLSALADSDYEMARLQTFQPTVQFLTGSAAQRVLKNYTKDTGFGRTPAHRGIALISFKDVDLRLFRNSFPELKFDVISNAPQDVLPSLESAVITGITTSYLEVDQRTGLVIVRDGNDISLRDLDTLTETYNTTLASLSSLMTLKSGHLMFVDTLGNLFAQNPFKDAVRHSYGADEGPAIKGTVSFVAFDDIRVPFDVALIPTATTGAFDIQKFDYNTDTGAAVMGSVTGLASYAMQDGIITGDAGVLYYFQFLLPTGTQNDLKIRRYTMTATGLTVDTTPTLQTTTLSNTIWGGNTTGVVLNKVIRDPNDNSFVLLFNTGYIVKISLAGAVQWTTQTALTLAGFTTVGEARSGLASPYYHFVATNGKVMRLNLTSGALEEVDDLVARSLPLPTGAQYYDAKTESVLYISADETLVRIFPNRIIAARVPLSRIIDDLVVESRLDPKFIDTSGADDVTIDGYYVDHKTSVRDTVNTLGSLYQITVEDNGERLVVRQEADVSSVVALTSADVLIDTVHVEETINEDLLDSLAARFVNIDDRGLIEVIETISLKSDKETADLATAQITLNLNDTPANVRAYLEQALRLRVAARRTFTAEVLPKHIGLTPRDRVQWDGETYRIRNHLIGIGEEGAVHADWFDPKVVENPVTISSASTYVNVYSAVPTTRKPYRPIVLFMNAVNDEDQSRCGKGSGTQVVYVGIDAPGRTISPAVNFGFKTFAKMPPPTPGVDTIQNYFNLIANSRITFEEPETINASPNYYTPDLSEGVHIGRLVTAPVDPTWQFKTDTTSAMVIKFDHPDTVSKFVTYANKYDVPENPRTNLLIVGREYIQFHGWSVAGDGLTVTFNTLFRGKFGTEPYMGTHVVGEHCFLYTPETFKATAINPIFTKRQQTAALFFRGLAPAGVPRINWGKRSDAGSARPYGPNPFGRRNRTEDIFFGHRRRSVQIDPMQGGGPMPSEWVPGQQAGYIFIEAALPVKPTIEEFETAYVRAQSALDIGTLRPDADNWGGAFEDTADQWLLIVEVVDDIFGHPTMWRVPGSSGSEAAGGLCDPFLAYDVGFPDGCIDGAVDFGGSFPGPNFGTNRGLSANPVCYPSNAAYTSEYDLGYNAGYSTAFFAGTC